MHMTWHASLALAAATALVFVACGCGDFAVTEPEALPALRTDRTRYVLTETPLGLGTEIIFTYRNPTNRDVQVHGCGGPGPPDLEKFQEGGWVLALRVMNFQCIAPPTVIRVGEAFTTRLPLSGALPGSDAGPKFHVEELDGTYRLVWSVVRSDSGRPLPLALRTSNVFQLEDSR